MKFYNNKISSFLEKIKESKLTAIIQSDIKSIFFYKNGEMHNNKNAAIIRCDEYKQFRLNGIYYGSKNRFTKESWRKYVKLRAFL